MGSLGLDNFHEVYRMAQFVACVCRKKHDSPKEYLQLVPVAGCHFGIFLVDEEG